MILPETKLYIVIGLLVGIGLSCQSNHRDKAALNTETLPTNDYKAYNDSLIEDGRSTIRSGDLVLRTGTDYSSEQVKDLSLQEKKYSHGGIAVVDSSGVYVYHIEPDFYYIKDKVRKEPLDSFCNPAHNYQFAVARYDINESERNILLRYMESQYQHKIPFDMAFRLETDNELYCSEMVRKGLALATSNRVMVGTIRLTDRKKFKLIRRHFKLKDEQIYNREIVPVDLLYLNPHCSFLKNYSFIRPN